MKRFAGLLVALWVGFAGHAWADPVRVGDSAASFEPPTGFRPLSQEVIDQKWASKRGPRFVVGNERATTTVAYDLKPNRIPQDRLHELQPVFEQVMERSVPGIRWVRKETIELAGQRWLFLELTSNAVDTDIHNIMLITGLGEQMLIFNFNSTRDEFPKVESALRASLRSITIAR